MKKCSIENCDNKHYANSYCSKHYYKYIKKRPSPEQYAWSHMKQRCFNPNNKRYKDYGGRGIKVCDEWVNDFKSFYNYIGERPSSNHSLDRIDNNGNYEPGNVRWSTYEEQNNNRRPRALFRINKNNTSGYTGISWIKNDRKWRVCTYLNYKQHLIGRYNTLDEAIKAKEAHIKTVSYSNM